MNGVGMEDQRQPNAALELKENSRRGAFPKKPHSSLQAAADDWQPDDRQTLKGETWPELCTQRPLRPVQRVHLRNYSAIHSVPSALQ